MLSRHDSSLQQARTYLSLLCFHLLLNYLDPYMALKTPSSESKPLFGDLKKLGGVQGFQTP